MPSLVAVVIVFLFFGAYTFTVQTLLMCPPCPLDWVQLLVPAIFVAFVTEITLFETLVFVSQNM